MAKRTGVASWMAGLVLVACFACDDGAAHVVAPSASVERTGPPPLPVVTPAAAPCRDPQAGRVRVVDSPQVFVYAGYVQRKGARPNPGTNVFESVRAHLNDDRYEQIELRPDGTVRYLGFYMYRRDKPEWSGNVSACWEWEGVGDLVHNHGVVAYVQGDARSLFHWSDRSLTPIVQDKLPEPALFDRVTPGGDPAATCPPAAPADAALLGVDPAAFIHTSKRRLVALVLTARGEATRVEADTRTERLAWSEQQGCWRSDGAQTRLTLTLGSGTSHLEFRGATLVERGSRGPVRSFVFATRL